MYYRLTPETTPPHLQFLWQAPEPPQELYIAGQRSAFEMLRQLPLHGLAVVGARDHTGRCEKLMDTVIKKLKDSPLVIVSGLARGIDTLAHLTAIKYGIPSIGISGVGIDTHYTDEYQALKNNLIGSGGLVITEYGPKVVTKPMHFLMRNRLIASYTQATWVVEAKKRSGALNTARWAREEGRTCYATPCHPDDTDFAGNRILIERDQALPLWSTSDLGSVWLDLAARK